MFEEDGRFQTFVMSYFSELFADIKAEDFDWSTFTLKPEAKNRLRKRKINEEKLIALLGERDTRMLKINTLLHSSLGSRASQGNKGKTPVYAFRTQVNNLIAAKESLQTSLSDSASLENINRNIAALEKAVQNLSVGSIDMTQGSGIFKTNSKNLLQEYSLVELIRATAKAIYAQAAISLIEGTFFESVLAAASQQIAQVGIEGFEEIKKALVVGSASGQITFDSSNFTKNIDLSSVLGSGYKPSGSVNGIIHYTIGGQQQGKMDVILTNNANQLAGGITAKSYQLKPSSRYPSISLVNATSILYMFQKKGEFLNHYLNQTVDQGPRPQNVVTQANDIMKQMILLQAIAGGGLRINEQYSTSGQNATIFAINDKSKPGGIKIIPVSQIFAKLVDAKSSVYDTGLDNNKRWPNAWAESGSKRITNLLSAVHAQKIKVSVSKSFINSI